MDRTHPDSGQPSGRRPLREKVKVRLTPSELAALQKSLPKPSIGPETTALQAAFQLGVEFTIRKLREGWTHEE